MHGNIKSTLLLPMTMWDKDNMTAMMIMFYNARGRLMAIARHGNMK